MDVPTNAEKLPDEPLDRSWVEKGACYRPNIPIEERRKRLDMFFMSNGAPSSRPKKECVKCLVAAECYSYAVDAGIQYGVWGGIVFTRYGKDESATQEA